MKFFIDTANIEEIREAASLGILDGVTTNPSLVYKEGKDFRKLLDEILKIRPARTVCQDTPQRVAHRDIRQRTPNAR